MRCPFLREAQVKFCQASPFRKMIVRSPGVTDHERCSSPDYVNCPAAKHRHEEFPSQSHCPFLSESLVQYCSAAPVIKYIPYSESGLSCCGNENHRYCELYLALAHASEGDAQATAGSAGSGEAETNEEAVPVPGHLAFSANHMWLDAGTDGCYHVGIDAFMAQVLGQLEGVSFITLKGVQRPTVVLTVSGVDLQVVFPNPMLITKANSYLRSHPEKLLADPYGLGWLFAGAEARPETTGGGKVDSGLIRGEAACAWMRRECRRMSEFVHEHVALRDLQGKPLMADGGSYGPGVAQNLNHEEKLHLFSRFFAPYASWSQQA